MKKIEEAKKILEAIGMPNSQQTDLCAFSLLALLDLEPEDEWSNCKNEWIRIHDIIQFISSQYQVAYAENSRETFRKQAMHKFRDAAIIEDNGKATNSPNYRYRITDEALNLFKSYNTSKWDNMLKSFLSNHHTLIELYASKKEMKKIPVKINGKDFKFSTGKHNALQKAILEEFAPRFAPNSECLYVGDTIEKDLVKNTDELNNIGFDISVHDKMPDIVLFKEDTKWIYFIEAVTSVGPVSPSRIIEINEMTKNVTAGKIFVTAFPNFSTYKKFSEQLAWETEVWIADMPDHMIHLNGDKFVGPRN